MLGQKDVLIEALKYFISHTRLNSRWPCPECHRKSAKHPLVQIRQILYDGTEMYSGCWYCNMEPCIREAEKALLRNGITI